jgi:hypothetical protein
VLDAEGYELVDPNQRAHLNGGSVYVEVRQKPSHIRGYVHDDRGKPLAGVSVVVAGLSALSNEVGYFELVIPGDRLQSSMTLKAVAPEYLPWSDTVVPNSNDVAISLQRKR